MTPAALLALGALLLALAAVRDLVPAGRTSRPVEALLSSTSVGKNPASVLPAPVGAISSTERPARALPSNSSWCARGVQPRLANQRMKISGSSDGWT